MKRPEHRPFKVLESEYLSRRPWFTVRRERVLLPTGAIVPEWYIFEFPDWVNVIAITRDGEFVLIDQYRHGLGQTRYELVAGCCEQGETAEQSARRELLEETGYGGGEWQLFMTTSANPTNHNNLVYTSLQPMSSLCKSLTPRRVRILMCIYSHAMRCANCSPPTR